MLRRIVTFTAALALGGGALAGVPTEEKLGAGPTVGELVEYALAKSPMITGAREDWRSRVENIRVMGGYEDPELMVEQMGFSDPTWNARLSIMAPFPGKIGASAEVAAREAAAARHEVDRTARDLAVSVREAGAEVAYLQVAGLVARKNGELLSRLDSLSQNAYAQKRAELIDLTRARGQVAKVGFDAKLLAELLASEVARLNLLLARPEGAPLGSIALIDPAPLAYSADEISALTLEKPEEIRIGQAEVARARAEERVASFSRYPDFNLSAFKNPLETGGVETYGFSVGFTIPLWQSKNDGRIAAAQAMVRREEAMLAAKRLELRSEARDLYFRVLNSERLYLLYRDRLLPQAAESAALAETWMKGGEGSLTDYVEVATNLYGFELAKARAAADHARYLARLERLAGKPLTVRAAEAGEVAK